jgi:hypothetical protein
LLQQLDLLEIQGEAAAKESVGEYEKYQHMYGRYQQLGCRLVEEEL